MAFKVNNPLMYTDPGKKLTKSPYGKQEWFGGSYNSSFTEESDRTTVAGNTGKMSEGNYKRKKTEAQARLSTIKTKKPSKPAPLNPSLPIEGPKQEVKFDTGFGDSGKKVIKDDIKVIKDDIKKQKTIVTPPKKTKASGKQSELSQTSLGKKGKQKRFGDEVTMQSTRNNKKSTPKENTLDAINKVSMKKFVPASKITTTVKAAPKDNSRKAIKARKTADKKAGVSKSQMRANKAKSKSEAASAKAKKSKNPSYRAQLTAKSERLAKRAARKGGSPAKLEDPKQRTHAQILKAYPGAVKVPGKINTYKYKGTTLKPALFPVKKKAKTVKQAIEIKEKK